VVDHLGDVGVVQFHQASPGEGCPSQAGVAAAIVGRAARRCPPLPAAYRWSGLPAGEAVKGTSRN